MNCNPQHALSHLCPRPFEQRATNNALAREMLQRTLDVSEQLLWLPAQLSEHAGTAGELGSTSDEASEHPCSLRAQRARLQLGVATEYRHCVPGVAARLRVAAAKGLHHLPPRPMKSRCWQALRQPQPAGRAIQIRPSRAEAMRHPAFQSLHARPVPWSHWLACLWLQQAQCCVHRVPWSTLRVHLKCRAERPGEQLQVSVSTPCKSYHWSLSLSIPALPKKCPSKRLLHQDRHAQELPRVGDLQS
mmetsp:Transcript_70948/g.125687  ORF Transcript_70948/g.125687 Transcript_70948/m.125687 type:complete len:246 (+) Transcript_70948:176-913(+)